MDHLNEPLNMGLIRRRQNVIQNQQRITRCVFFGKGEEDANAKRVEVGLTVVALRWHIVFGFKSAGYVEAASPGRIELEFDVPQLFSGMEFAVQNVHSVRDDI